MVTDAHAGGVCGGGDRYQPNEVKHRKRTTRQQLRVLEDVYKNDTKPNAGLRKKLAEELGMTPRGVQVRFTGFWVLCCVRVYRMWC